MAAHASPQPLGFDPLIAEAKRRARRRRWLLLVAAAVVAATAVGATLGPRSSGNALGVCATPPSGWKARTLTNIPLAPPTVVLTNFRFGRVDDGYGLWDYRLRWPRDGVMISVSNERPALPEPLGNVLRVTRADFGRVEGAPRSAAQVLVDSHGRLLHAIAEVGQLTPATIAAANHALAGARTCSQ